MIRIPRRDRPENEYILIAAEEERMLVHREVLVNRMLDFLRARYARVTVTRETDRNGGAFGVMQFIATLSLRCEKENGDAIDVVTEIDVGSATTEADEGYFTASQPSDEALELMVMEMEPEKDPRQRMLFDRDRSEA